jgi:hypothetical protein
MDLIIIQKRTEGNFSRILFCRAGDQAQIGSKATKSRRKLSMNYRGMQEIYFDQAKGSFCISLRSLARNLGCHPQTINNILKKNIAADKIIVAKEKLTYHHLSRTSAVIYEDAFYTFLEIVTNYNNLSDKIKAKALTFWVNYNSFKKDYISFTALPDFELDHMEMSLAPEHRRTLYPIKKL